MKKVYLLPLFASILLMFSCGGDSKPVEEKVEEKVEEVQEKVEEEIVEEVMEEEVDHSATLANVGIGPIKELVLPAEIDEAMAEKGKKLYTDKGCTACHNPTMRIVGPPQKGVFEKRNPAWVMNIILNTAEMLEKDPDAIALLEEYNNVPMISQEVTEEEARAMVEYFRTL